MMNKKLMAIASFIDQDDTVLDTCSDHAYLAIYLKKNHLCRDVYASDINPNALNVAKKNISNAKVKITTYLSDGFHNIENDKIDTVVIAGVGTNTVLDILEGAPKNIRKFIISSNNHLDILRKSLYKKDLYIQKEIVVFEKQKYYIVMLVTKDYIKENKFTLKYGKSNNLEYFRHLIKKEEEVLTKIPRNKIFTRYLHKRNIALLKTFMQKI